MAKEATNKINYQGKIVISEKRKAKVLKDAQNELTIIFQENGKYQGKVATVKKGEVSLLDKRKHPEKYFLKTNKKVNKKRGDKKENNELPQNTPRWRKIELLLEAFEKNPKNPDYPLLLLFEKKTLEIVVNQFPNSRVINLLAKVTEKYYLAWFEYDLNELEKDPTNMKNINYFKERVKEAKEESIVTIDTKQYEDRLPQNSKELYYLAQLKDFLEAFEKNPTNLYALKDIKNYVEQSEKESIDVSAYKALLPELTIKHYEAKLEKYFNELQKDPEDSI